MKLILSNNDQLKKARGVPSIFEFQRGSDAAVVGKKSESDIHRVRLDESHDLIDVQSPINALFGLF